MVLHGLRSRAAHAACGVCLLWCTGAVASGPGTSAPEAVFPCGPLPGNLEEYAAAADACQHAAELIRQVLKVHETSGFKRAMLLEIGKAATAAVQAERRIKRLELVGEPACFQLGDLIRDLNAPLMELRLKIIADTAVGKQVASTRERWLNESNKQQKLIPKAEQLAEQKKWDKAAQALYDPMDKLMPQGYWYDASTQMSGYGPFQNVLGRIEPEILVMVHARAMDERKQAIARETPDFAAIERDVGAAIESVAATGKGNFDGQEQAGPELLAAIGARWRQAQLATWRARAHYWGFRQLIGGAPPELGALEKEHERFTGAMVQACAHLVEVDAARAAASDVADLHRAYVGVLTPLMEFDHGRVLADSVGQSLEKLAARSPEFAADLAAYARATADLLRWRERAAAAQTRRYQADFQASVVPYEEIRRCNSNVDSSKLPQTNNFLCNRRVAELIAQANPKVVGQRAMFGDVSSLAAGGAVSMYDNRHYARLTAGVDLSATVAELRQCLFAQDSSPPRPWKLTWHSPLPNMVVASRSAERSKASNWTR
ncbi:MAG TPA: hypothetical protein VND64_26555 [Pirellulales bacterium]|nr:hypothetical protein [Pirellulales bacterium]